MSDSKFNDEMPLMSHLLELRTRLMKMIGSIVVLFFTLVYWRNDIYEMVSAPLRARLPEGSIMIATDVTAPFMAPFKLTFLVSIFIAVPFLLYQIWAFIAPALYKHERRLAIPLMASSIVLFYLGVAFAYFLTLPAILGFFSNAGPETVTAMPDINSYLDFVLKLFLVFGFTFEVPVAVFLLIWSGLVTSDSLIDKRRYIIVGCFFVSMFLTPPDAFSMAMLAIPMWLLFEAGLFLGRIMEKRRLTANS